MTGPALDGLGIMLIVGIKIMNAKLQSSTSGFDCTIGDIKDVIL
jgi:hypothetical protein